jgi:hypothetical protein
MDCVYICRPGDNEELRYSIRSVVKNLPHDNLWLVGYKPSWYVGNFIPVSNTTTKFENIRLAIKAAAEHNEISDDFILMNDDFFVIKPASPDVVLHGGLLTDKISRYRSMLETGRYITLLENTYKFLIKSGIKNPLDYDIHTPMVFNKSNLLKIINRRHFPRSLYGNIFKVGGKFTNDVKVYPDNSLLKYDIQQDSPYISTQDDSFDNLFNSLLKDMFSDQSKYEHP